jgi:hypothetical protein
MIAEQHVLLPQFSLQFEATLRESLLSSLGEHRLAQIEAGEHEFLDDTAKRTGSCNASQHFRGR